MDRTLTDLCITLFLGLISRCRCGQCDIALLENVKECKCCKEIEECVAAIHGERVLEELGKPPECVIGHPGFAPTCLNQWTLELLADQNKKTQKTRYRNLGSEKMFVVNFFFTI